MLTLVRRLAGPFGLGFKNAVAKARQALAAAGIRLKRKREREAYAAALADPRYVVQSLRSLASLRLGRRAARARRTTLRCSTARRLADSFARSSSATSCAHATPHLNRSITLPWYNNLFALLPFFFQLLKFCE